jgi:glutamine amidotransferase
MCRQLAYVGPPLPLSQLLLDPPNALVRQAWAPQRQSHGVVNADGYGLGWYERPGEEPLRHRGAGPVWADETVAELAASRCVTGALASVRSATAGTAHGVSSAMPFRRDRWLFGHNGALHGWPDAAAPLAGRLDVRRLLRLDAMTDAALLWALVLDRLDAGDSALSAVGGVVQRAAADCGGRLNLLLTDGERVVASAWGASLSYRQGADGVVVASEPLDDDPGWVDVPDRSLLIADRSAVTVTTL